MIGHCPPCVYPDPHVYLMSRTWLFLPGLPPPFLHAVCNQKLEAGTAWERGYNNPILRYACQVPRAVIIPWNGTEQFRHIILQNGAGSYRRTIIALAASPNTNSGISIPGMFNPCISYIHNWMNAALWWPLVLNWSLSDYIPHSFSKCIWWLPLQLLCRS